MPVELPAPRELRALSARLRLGLDDGELREVLDFMAEMKRSYDELDRLAEPRPAAMPREPGRRPDPAENPHGAWVWRTRIEGAADGPLAGRRMAVKDNICVAGLPMRNGSWLMEGYVAETDATVVTRVLEAGATILGKVACEDLCLSGASHTAKTGAVRNPRRPTHSSGGSSSGSAAVLASGEADMALGGDQGGSIRIPASWSGVCGLKPTHGLVPYTGIFPIEMTLDHCGPMAATVADVAALLAVIAGPDGHDPRQVDVRLGDYLGAVAEPSATGLRVGLLHEGFGQPESEPAVDAAVRAAAGRFTELGATVAEVSLPMHRLGYHVWATILIEGSTELLLRGDATGSNWQGRYTTDLQAAVARGLRERPGQLAETGKVNLLMAEHVRERHGRRYYAKAQNLRPLLRSAYDEALREFDVLVLPTVPFRATRLPPADAPFAEVVARARDRIDANTAPLDASGHPALSVPCATLDGLPVGMMLVGRRWGDATVLRAGHAIESLLQAAPA